MSTSEVKKNQITLQGPQNYLEWASGMRSLLMVFGVWCYANTNVAAPVAPAVAAGAALPAAHLAEVALMRRTETSVSDSLLPSCLESYARTT